MPEGDVQVPAIIRREFGPRDLRLQDRPPSGSGRRRPARLKPIQDQANDAVFVHGSPAKLESPVKSLFLEGDSPAVAFREGG